MVTILLSLGSALAYGVSDFLGGVFSRRTSPWSVAVVGQLSSALLTLVVAAFVGGSLVRADLAWAAAGGLGTGLGTGFLYRGLAAGRMSVVAPLSAVGAAVVPVVAGAAGGERPSLAVWGGILAALPAIWLVASEPATDQPAAPLAEGVVDGVLAGLGFGLLFAALGQVSGSAGLWPSAVAQVVSVPTVVLLAVLLGADWLPRERAAAGGVLAGALGAVATAAFLVATRHGFLAVAGVLASLYPAVTVLLAMTVLREHIHRHQAFGLLMCGLAITLVAAG